MDFLIHDDQLYFVEINPRFQGSSLMSARLDAAADRPDVFLAHLAAYLGIPLMQSSSLEDILTQPAAAAQLIMHNISGNIMERKALPAAPSDTAIELCPAPGIRIMPNAALCRICFGRRVTQRGFELCAEAKAVIARISRSEEYGLLPDLAASSARPAAD